MRTAFEEAFTYLFQNESDRYTDDPLDSGGPTKYGVTLKAYGAFLGRAVTSEEIRDLTQEQAYAFYLARYWAPLECRLIRSRMVATAIFDTGALYGVGTAAILAQKATGAPLKIDGVLGPESLSAINSADPHQFVRALRDQILARIDAVIRINPKNERFREGWKHRADRLLTLSTDAPLNRRAP